MATIKIDRGFTQKVQAKGLSHSITEHPHPSPKPKRPQGSKVPLVLAAAAGVFVVAAVVVAVLLASGSGNKAGKEKPVQQANAVPVQRPVAAPAQDGPVEPVEDTALYEQAAKPAAAVPPQASSGKPSEPVRPILREVPLGSPQGLLCEYFEQINGSQVSHLRAAPSFPELPSRTVQVGRFELSEKLGEHYGARVRGYVVPPKSGAYTFVVNVDDAAEFWLSSDDQPANLRKLVTLTTHTSKKWTLRPEQKSEPCDLIEGKRYYLETLMMQGTSGDYLAVGWTGPVSEAITIIEGRYLLPWSATRTAEQVASALEASAADKRRAREAQESARAPALAAVAEQQRVNGVAYRFAEAARALKTDTKFRNNPDVQSVLDVAVLRYETLSTLRAFVQAELARSRLRGVWVAFGGQADVTGADGEGVTVAPGRIVAWDKIPADQMLRLVNATVPKAEGDADTKGVLLLAAALFCKDIQGGIDLALKYRARAVAASPRLAPLADRLLGGTPEALVAQPRIKVLLAELSRLAPEAAGLREKTAKRQAELTALLSAPQPGLTVEYWENVTGSLDEIRTRGLTAKTQPDSSQRLADFSLPENRAEKYFARVKGYLTPPATGDYLFYIAADDHGEFWLSPDENPDTAVMHVKNDAPGGRRVWDKEKRKSKPVSLEKGRQYFVRALLREGQGGDHLAVAWSLAAEDNPKLITADSLFCERSAGLLPGAQEARTKIEEEFLKVSALTAEITRGCEAEAALDLDLTSATGAMADALQKQVERVKASVLEAEGVLQRIDAALQQLKASLRPESGRS